MDMSSQDPPLIAMDLSKSYNPLTRGHAEAIDLAKKPEWYHRRPPSCSTDVSSSYRSRASSSFNSLSAQPGASAHRRDMEQGSEALGNYMNSTLAPGLDLYHEGIHSNLWHPGFYGPDQSSSGGGPVPESSIGEESDSGSDVIFLVSSSKEPLICSSFIQDGVRHIVEPLSPAMSSLDEGRGCYHLPQPLSSPSPDSSYSEDSSDSSVDIPVHHTRPVVLLSDLSTIYGNPAESPVDISSDDSDVIEVSVTNKKNNNCAFPCKKNGPSKKSVVIETLHQSNGEKAPRKVRRSSRIRKPASDTPLFTCSASRHSLRRQVKNDAVGIYNESGDSDDVMEYTLRSSSPEPEESALQLNASQRVSSNSEESDLNAEIERKPPQRDRPPNINNAKQKKLSCVHKAKKLRGTKQQKHRAPPQQRQKASSCRNVEVRNKPAQRQKRERQDPIRPSALFTHREPEIKLKYAKLKEEKKYKKSVGFCPFVHMEQRMCTVVNFQEEEVTVRNSRGQQQAVASRPLSGFVPSTSCFQLGRLNSENRCQATLSCCLCGQTASVMGLGDLHGPYYPAAPSVDGHNCSARQKEETNLNRLANSLSVNPSLPKLPLHLDECWIHEDCSIWSTGVFLVRGKLYGLAEAAWLARETVCSSCQQMGAIMGCFQKSCPRNYHYRCAIQSGCVLNEENFSMRCTEHKNKPFKSRTRQHKR